MENPTAELVAKAVSGNRDALSDLLKYYGPQIRARIKVNPVWQSVLDPADVMQVTYLEAFLRIDRLQTKTLEGFQAWLSRIADNNLRDAIKELDRAKRPDPRRRISAPSTASTTVELLEVLGWTSATPSQHMAVREAETRLRAAIVELPDNYRAVVESCDIQGRSVADVAVEMGRTVGAVHMLRLRAHDRLREILGSESVFLSTRS